jgi:hypothetical protein
MVAVPQLKAALEMAVRARGTQYSTIMAFAVHWGDDNTLAKEDNQTFTAMMRDMFDVPCETFLLNSKSSMAAWDLKLQLIQAIKANLKNLKPSLLVLSYAGHGVIDTLGGLSFASQGNKKLVSWVPPPVRENLPCRGRACSLLFDLGFMFQSTIENSDYII